MGIFYPKCFLGFWGKWGKWAKLHLKCLPRRFFASGANRVASSGLSFLNLINWFLPALPSCLFLKLTPPPTPSKNARTKLVKIFCWFFGGRGGRAGIPPLFFQFFSTLVPLFWTVHIGYQSAPALKRCSKINRDELPEKDTWLDLDITIWRRHFITTKNIAIRRRHFICVKTS